MEDFVRLKIVLATAEGVPEQHKMMAARANMTWGAFRQAAVEKLGFTTSSQFGFYWEDCTIDEPDDLALAMFVKDGDTLVLMPHSHHTLSRPEDCDAYRPVGRSIPIQIDATTEGPGEVRAGSTAEAGRGRDIRSTEKPTMAQFASQERFIGIGGPRQLLENRPSELEHAEQAVRTDTQDMSQNDQVPDAGSPGDSKRCSCKHSKCVKLYCICFASGMRCNEGCICLDCVNIPENRDFLEMEQARCRSRNPLAFSQKVEQGQDGEVLHKIGCRCRRSHCVKKYCECYDGGVRCSPQCRCADCHNKPDGPNDGCSDDAPVDNGGLASLASAAQLSGLLSSSYDQVAMAGAVVQRTTAYHSAFQPVRGDAGGVQQDSAGRGHEAITTAVSQRVLELQGHSSAKTPGVQRGVGSSGSIAELAARAASASPHAAATGGSPRWASDLQHSGSEGLAGPSVDGQQLQPKAWRQTRQSPEAAGKMQVTENLAQARLGRHQQQQSPLQQQQSPLQQQHQESGQKRRSSSNSNMSAGARPSSSQPTANEVMRSREGGAPSPQARDNTQQELRHAAGGGMPSGDAPRPAEVTRAAPGTASPSTQQLSLDHGDAPGRHQPPQPVMPFSAPGSTLLATLAKRSSMSNGHSNRSGSDDGQAPRAWLPLQEASTSVDARAAHMPAGSIIMQLKQQQQQQQLQQAGGMVGGSILKQLQQQQQMGSIMHHLQQQQQQQQHLSRSTPGGSILKQLQQQQQQKEQQMGGRSAAGGIMQQLQQKHSVSMLQQQPHTMAKPSLVDMEGNLQVYPNFSLPGGELGYLVLCPQAGAAMSSGAPVMMVPLMAPFGVSPSQARPSEQPHALQPSFSREGAGYVVAATLKEDPL